MERSTEIEDAFKFFCTLRSRGDSSSFSDVYSTQMKLLIGSRPDQWWEDLQTIKNAFGGQGMVLSHTDPLGYVDGDLGWVVDRPRWTKADGSTATTRMTVIMRREHKTWKIVHLHNSAGVSDETLFCSDAKAV